MNTAELQTRVESSAELSAVRDRVANALSVKSGNQYAFDPLTIIAIISVIVQVIQYCVSLRNPDDVAADMKKVHELPPRKLMRFKRRSNVLWKKYCSDHGLDANTPNPIPDAVYSLGGQINDSEIAAFITLAQS